MAKKNIASYSPHEIADRYLQVNGEIIAYEEGMKVLKKKKEELRSMMLVSLKEYKTDSFRIPGTEVTFARAYRSSIAITDIEKALPWALKHGCAKVDIKEATKALRGIGALPQGFEQKEKEYLSTSGLNSNAEE